MFIIYKKGQVLIISNTFNVSILICQFCIDPTLASVIRLINSLLTHILFGIDNYRRTLPPEGFAAQPLQNQLIHCRH